MIVRFFDLEDQSNPLNGIAIDDDKQLIELLDGFHSRDPFFAELRGDNGYELSIGIGRVGCAQYSHGEGDPPYLVALADTPYAGKDYDGFLTGGTLTPVPRRFIMPFEKIKQIALHF